MGAGGGREDGEEGLKGQLVRKKGKGDHGGPRLLGWRLRLGWGLRRGRGQERGGGGGEGGLTSAGGGPPAVPEQEASSSRALVRSHPQGHLVAGGDYGRGSEGPAEASELLARGSRPGKDLQRIVPAAGVLLQVKDSEGEGHSLALRDLTVGTGAGSCKVRPNTTRQRAPLFPPSVSYRDWA